MVTAKSILSSSHQPSLGRPLAINGLWTLYKPLAYFQPPTDWRRQPESGGPVLINLVHEVDLMHHLLGPITRVQADRGPVSPAARGSEHRVESGAAVLFRFASGAVGTFLLADNLPSPFNFEAGTGENPTIPRAGMDFYRIFCEEGVLSVPDMRVWRYDSRGGEEGKSWTEPLTQQQLDVAEMKVPFELQVEHFIRVIRGEEEPSCSGEDGLRALVVCDAVRKALETGQAVDITI
jgi:predicted dehydrogenase